MDIQENIINKVAQSGLVTLDPAAFYPTGTRVIYDIKDNLFQGLILREKDFREFVKAHDWTQYEGKNVGITCSADAIVPAWAYMLLANRLAPYAKEVVFGDLETLETVLFEKSLSALDVEQYRDRRIVIKGCGDTPVPVSAYVELTKKLTPVVKSLMFGEPCSTVPIYKKETNFKGTIIPCTPLALLFTRPKYYYATNIVSVIMNKYLGIAFVLMVTASLVTGQEIIRAGEPVFKVGEQLNYRLKYGFFTAAEANLKVEKSDKKFDGKPAYHIVADAKTAGAFDVFYKVRNRYETYVDEATLQPYFYTENRHESNYKHSDNVTFDHQDDKITAAKGVYPLKGKVFDFLSAYYFSRGIDAARIRIGQKFDLQYFLEDGVHTLSITYAGKEKVSSAVGTFNCLKFNPTIIPGRVFRKDSKLYLWITDDENRIPVKAHVELIVGSLTMELASVKNLKFPLNPISK